MKAKKLYFFNLKWRDYPNWQIFFFSLIPTLLVYIPIWFLDSKLWLVPGMVIYIAFFVYFIWVRTLKNFVEWKRESNLLLKIDKKKLVLDLNFLSQVWIENEELHIRRINRVDSFPIYHLRKEDIEKLVGLLKEYESKEA